MGTMAAFGTFMLGLLNFSNFFQNREVVNKVKLYEKLKTGLADPTQRENILSYMEHQNITESQVDDFLSARAGYLALRQMS